MSDCIQLDEGIIWLPKTNYDDALKVLKEKFPDICGNEKTLTDAMECFEYVCEEGFYDVDDTSIEGIVWVNRKEHMTFYYKESLEMWKALAPYIESESNLIYYDSENNSKWQWEFRGGKVYEEIGYTEFGLPGIIWKILKKKEVLPVLLGIDPKLDKRIEEILQED